MARLITPLVEERLERSTSKSDPGDEPLDILQWVINSPPKDYTWTSRQLISSMLSFCLPSTPTALTLSYVLLDLCKHPEFTELLRHQIRELPTDDTFCTRLNRLPALDSFLKESARLSPGNSTAVSRQTLVPYTFSGPDGPHVPAGNWISVPSRSIMRDPAHYTSPETFDPLRFATNVIATGETDMEVNAAHVKYTDASYKYPLWGLGKRICPGRFYASIALKLVVAEMVLNYDLKLADEKGAAGNESFFSFDSFRVPRAGISMRRRFSNGDVGVGDA
ncbi:hypothetical protein MMC22_008690 [Lobaria immixta]|nr:hypothetical protein [Lobaria immixta]